MYECTLDNYIDMSWNMTIRHYSQNKQWTKKQWTKTNSEQKKQWTKKKSAILLNIGNDKTHVKNHPNAGNRWQSLDNRYAIASCI